MQCCATVRTTLRKQETSQLSMEGTGEGCGFLCFFSQQFCRRLYIFKIIIFYFLGQDKMMDKLNLTKEEKGKRF